MKFVYDEDQQALQASTRGLLERRQPAAGARRLLEAGPGLDRAGWRQGAELGWFSMLAPEAAGGGSLSGQGLVDATALAEEWGRALAGGPLISTNVAINALSAHGTSEHQSLLPALVSGTTLITVALAEDAGDWDPHRTATRAERAGERFYLTGTKVLVEAAADAEWLLVTARDGERVIAMLVAADAEGISVQPHRSLDLTRPLGRVSFDRTPVESTAVLSTGSMAAFQEWIDLGAVLACADSVGGAERVVEMTVEYTRQRVQFGRPIASFQAIRHRCADMLLALEGARAATRYAALAAGDGFPDAQGAVDLAKAHVGDATAMVTGEGIQLHGGIGFTWDHDMHLFARRARTNAVLFGTTAWRRSRSWDRLAPTAEVG
ncbi:acyl-CoA dehydrogenase family protein [Acidiferrimicrobium sp. IK]|uniref:acyl-CoA dehydrogenase family protein n=1 Tax=Acidiferrimicrobium sp. IK TaxID=2871700 RepID=UPI0021CB1DAC|nr:acyl-CoA dehydrogenase family protein [Acidiferrimicrobium sp. IK]MCU4183437.1 acyl-CoA dehydrogenase family protein [Acidiferrimicrobium sp. IK]